MSAPKTVKVRIAVAVDPKGKWSSAGWSDEMDDELVSNCLEFLDSYCEAVFFLTAEIPVPDATEIAATVDPA